jgi:hypothetical protein
MRTTRRSEYPLFVSKISPMLESLFYDKAALRMGKFEVDREIVIAEASAWNPS